MPCPLGLETGVKALADATDFMRHAGEQREREREREGMAGQAKREAREGSQDAFRRGLFVRDERTSVISG